MQVTIAVQNGTQNEVDMCFKSMVLFVAVAALSSNVWAASITEIPDLFEGKFRMIQQLMPDGNSVMGVAGNEVFRWTPDGGRQSLGLLGPEVNIIPTAISGDGTTIVGRRIGNYSQEAIRWTIAGGLEVLPTVGSHPHNPTPSHLSDDGNIVYGTSYKKFTNPVLDLYQLGLIPYPYFTSTDGNQSAQFRWEASVGFETLPSWVPETNEAFSDDRTIRGVSADGNAVAGVIGRAPAIWTEATGVQQHASLPTDSGSSSTDLLSADGTTLVGKYYLSDCRYQASGCIPGAVGTSGPYLFRWTIGEELELLPETQDSYVDAYAISGDGRTILGYIDTPEGDQGYDFIWRSGHGMQSILDYFGAYGITLPFPGYHSVSEMSRDGMVFVGTTTNPLSTNGNIPTFQTTQWVVDLRQVVPEPGAMELTVLAVCICGVGVRARR